MGQYQKEKVIAYLIRHLETFSNTREFAEYHLARLNFEAELFPTPSMLKEHDEYLTQRDLCNRHIYDLQDCIKWVRGVKIIELQDNEKQE